MVVAQARADADVREVGAASILAKTARDAYMLDVHARYPQYAFDQHKGYGTTAYGGAGRAALPRAPAQLRTGRAVAIALVSSD